MLLGLLALPVAALLYWIAQGLAPRVMEPVPEPALESLAESSAEGSAGQAGRSAARWRLTGRPLTVIRLGVAAVVLALLAFGVSRWPAVSPGRSAVPAAVAVQLPPPAPLKVQTRAAGDGSGPGQLHDPRDLAVGPDGSVYVADTGNKRVVQFKPDGSPARSWTESGKGAFLEPSSLAVVGDGLIVADSEAAQLHKFNFDGKPVPGFEHDLAVSHPRGLAAGADGTIYIGDTANNRVLKVGPDGAPRGDLDTKGTKLEQPTGVAIDDQGSIYTIEPAASRIQKFSPEGVLQAHLFVPGTVTVLPPRAVWIPGRGLTASLPEQNALLTYGPAGTPDAAFAPEAPLPQRPGGLGVAVDKQSVWVVWNGSGELTLLLWP